MRGTEPIRLLASPGTAGADGNPYIDLLLRGVGEQGVEVAAFDRRRLLEARGVVHVHWPAALVRWDRSPRAVADVAKVLLGIALARRRGARLVWTGHDLEPHELRRPVLYRLYFAAFSRMIDLWISLTPAGAAELRRRYPVLARRPMRVIPHGSYRTAYDRPETRAGADEALGLPPARRSYLLLGQLRPYKNALPLLRAFAADADPDARLLVAGEVRGDARLADALRDAAPAGAVLRLERVPGAEIPAWHAAADVVVLPYDARSALNSGALLLALSLDTPVVVADSPVNRELRREVGEEWVHLFEGDAGQALALAKRVAGTRRTGRPDLSAFEWPAITRATAEAYRDLMAGRA